VRDELPRLLGDFDGLPEDEIAELTQEGPGLVPPSPELRPAGWDGSDWESEADEEYDSETEEDNWEGDSQGAEDDGREAEEDGCWDPCSNNPVVQQESTRYLTN
jgi:hypothetical protein